MPTFAPFHPPTKGQTNYLVKQQKILSKKRKREDEDDEASATTNRSSPDLEDSTVRLGSNTFRPVNKTDPFFVAGLSRSEPLPPYPFPIAGLKSRTPHSCASVDQELAELKPPLFAPREKSSSSKRKFLSAVTTILHRCMLDHDWNRASRALGILLRTKVFNKDIDLRQQGRWGIAGEILMRRSDPKTLKQPRHIPAGDENSDQLTNDDHTPSLHESHTSDEGFRVAKQLYERMVLQYPHTARSQHSINALTFYPALFNVWLYEVQDRSKRARKALVQDRPTSSQASDSSINSEHNSDPDPQSLASIRQQELQEGLAIAQRMDELMMSPPFDTSAPLLQLRGMMGLWLADLYVLQRNPGPGASSSDSSSSDLHSPTFGGYQTRSRVSQMMEAARRERELASSLLKKAKIRGAALNDEYLAGFDDQEPLSE